MNGNTLQHFQKRELVITREQASRVLRFFFPDQPADVRTLTDDDMGFAQALLIQAINSSNEVSYVKVLFDKAYMKPPIDFSFIKDIVQELTKRAAQNWFNHASGKDLKNPSISEAVRRTIQANFRSVWAIRLQTGELTY